MGSFHGFSAKGSPVEIPANFFTELLQEIGDIYALKILLFAFQLGSGTEDQISYFIPDNMCAQYFAEDQTSFWQGLSLAIEQDWLLDLETQIEGKLTRICLLNTPRNAAALEAIQQGKMTLTLQGEPVQNQRPDIFSLYEQNIGPLTPIIADSLKELETNYPPDWISKAIQTAVKNNARSLRYIEVVLQNWQEEGKYERTDRRRRQKTSEEFDPEGYTDGEFSDFIDY